MAEETGEGVPQQPVSFPQKIPRPHLGQLNWHPRRSHPRSSPRDLVTCLPSSHPSSELLGVDAWSLSSLSSPHGAGLILYWELDGLSKPLSFLGPEACPVFELTLSEARMTETVSQGSKQGFLTADGVSGVQAPLST